MRLFSSTSSLGSVLRQRCIHTVSEGTTASTSTAVQARAQARIASAAPAPAFPLLDRHGRQHTYLRISLTERCNLRCTYCMPENGLSDLTPRTQLLSTSEIHRLAKLFVQQGVDKIRLTGGEPTVRRDIVDIVGGLSELKSIGLRQVGMTSNGLLLTRLLPQLKSAGLTHLNVSLDTLDAHVFELITRRPAAGLTRVLRGIDESIASGVLTKVNVVIVRGVNDGQDVLSFVEWTKQRNVVVRFIEYMPFDGNKWRPDKLVPYKTLLERIEARFGPLQRVVDDPHDTSKHWRVPGSAGTLGFITSMTDHFCGTCNRLRITADGNLKVCLFGNAEVSLRDAMRSGLPVELGGTGLDVPASDAQLLRIVGAAVGRKHARHAGMSDPEELARAENRSMIRIVSLGAPRRSFNTVPSSALFPYARLPPNASQARLYSTKSPKPPSAIAERLDTSSSRTNEPSIPRHAHLSWSEYMSESDEDSPWASLDAIADGAARLSVPLAPTEPRLGERNAMPELVSGSFDQQEQERQRGAKLARGEEALRRYAARLREQQAEQAAPSTRRLTHLNPGSTHASMVDVSSKLHTHRSATAVARLHVPLSIVPLLRASESGQSSNSHAAIAVAPAGWKAKGPVLHTAQLAGIMAAKRTAELIPLCHSLPLSHVEVQLEIVEPVSEAEQKRYDAGQERGMQESSDVKHDFTVHPLEAPWDETTLEANEQAWIQRELHSTSSNTGATLAPSTYASSNGAYIQVACTARTTGQTGVEMEALTGASVACLTLWDMLKSLGGKEMRIEATYVSAKSGGKSGDWTRQE